MTRKSLSVITALATLSGFTAQADFVEIDVDMLPAGSYGPGEVLVANSFTEITSETGFTIAEGFVMIPSDLPGGPFPWEGQLTIRNTVEINFDTASVSVDQISLRGASNNVGVGIDLINVDGESFGAFTDAWFTSPEWFPVTIPLLPGQLGSIATVRVTLLEGELGWIGISFVSIVDSDGDGINESEDNCTAIANPDQTDSDGDGIGNACDPDLNNDCIVDLLDLAGFRTVFLTSDEDADLNGDGTVDLLDLAVVRNFFLAEPGPSATECVP